MSQEFKYYGKWNEFDVEGLCKLETHTFTWEKIAVKLESAPNLPE